MNRKKLGEILIEQEATTPEAVARALAAQKLAGLKIGRMLVSQRAINEQQLARALAAQSQMPLAKMDEPIPEDLVALIGSGLARKRQALPFSRRAGDKTETIYVALADPYDLTAMDEIQFRIGRPVKFALAPADELAHAISRAFPLADPAATTAPMSRAAAAPAADGEETLERPRRAPAARAFDPEDTLENPRRTLQAARQATDAEDEPEKTRRVPPAELARIRALANALPSPQRSSKIEPLPAQKTELEAAGDDPFDHSAPAEAASFQGGPAETAQDLSLELPESDGEPLALETGADSALALSAETFATPVGRLPTRVDRPKPIPEQKTDPSGEFELPEIDQSSPAEVMAAMAAAPSPAGEELAFDDGGAVPLETGAESSMALSASTFEDPGAAGAPLGVEETEVLELSEADVVAAEPAPEDASYFEPPQNVPTVIGQPSAEVEALLRAARGEVEPVTKPRRTLSDYERQALALAQPPPEPQAPVEPQLDTGWGEAVPTAPEAAPAAEEHLDGGWSEPAPVSDPVEPASEDAPAEQPVEVAWAEPAPVAEAAAVPEPQLDGAWGEAVPAFDAAAPAEDAPAAHEVGWEDAQPAAVPPAPEDGAAYEGSAALAPDGLATFGAEEQANPDSEGGSLEIAEEAAEPAPEAAAEPWPSGDAESVDVDLGATAEPLAAEAADEQWIAAEPPRATTPAEDDETSFAGLTDAPAPAAEPQPQAEAAEAPADEWEIESGFSPERAHAAAPEAGFEEEPARPSGPVSAAADPLLPRADVVTYQPEPASELETPPQAPEPAARFDELPDPFEAEATATMAGAEAIGQDGWEPAPETAAPPESDPFQQPMSAAEPPPPEQPTAFFARPSGKTTSLQAGPEVSAELFDATEISELSADAPPAAEDQAAASDEPVAVEEQSPAQESPPLEDATATTAAAAWPLASVLGPIADGTSPEGAPYTAADLAQALARLLEWLGYLAPGDAEALLSEAPERLGAIAARVLLDQQLIGADDLLAMVAVGPLRANAMILLFLVERGIVAEESILQLLPACPSAA